jgi:hypothetical protein
MSALGSKLRALEGGKVTFWCPACDDSHIIGIAAPARTVWNFNGNGDAPTFTPSVLMEYERAEPPVTFENLDEYRRKPWPQTKKRYVCHSYVTNGRIQFLPDCTHALAGQTVDLPDWPLVKKL